MPKKRPLAVMKRKATTPQAQGAQPGNGNALVHGAFATLSRRNMDQRSKLARALRSVEADLVTALGDDPTPQERMLIDRVVYKLCRCVLFESATLSGATDGATNDAHYLSWSNSLRLDLQALGLERRAKDITPPLSEYLAERYGGAAREDRESGEPQT